MSKRIIKAAIKKHRTSGYTEFTHPDTWDATKIQVIAYEDSDQLGDVIEYCIGVVDVEDLPKFLASQDIVEIDIAEANILVNKWRNTQDVHIADPRAVINALTTDSNENTKVLDPNDPTPGLNKRKPIDVCDYL